LLAGIRFELVNDEKSDWSVLLKILEDGEAAMISELIRTPEREERFLWPETALMTDYYALLSKNEYPNGRSEYLITAVWQRGSSVHGL